MLELSVRFDAKAMEQALLRTVGTEARRVAMAKAATRMVAAARTEVIKRLPEVFDRPTPFTMRSVRYEPATPENLTARVFISEDANRGLSPRKYLGPEIIGGNRGMKRSERALLMRGMLQPDQRMVPSKQLALDAYGNVSASRMVSILGRVQAFGEQGYTANAAAKTKRRLGKMKLAVKSTGTDYFVVHGRDGRPLGIWQLVSPGHVRPVLIFTDKAPLYRKRFPFEDTAFRVFRDRWHDEVLRAILEGAR